MTKQKSPMCIWSYDDNYDYYETSCGGSFILTDGTLKENKMRFCCYCGKSIREVRLKT